MTPPTHAPARLERLPSGIPGFDQITDGGLPAGGVTLVAGTAGSGKTVLAMQFLAAGINAYDEPAVFVSLAEAPDKIRRFVAEFGWAVSAWEEQGCFALVDATTSAANGRVVVGENIEFGVLLGRIEAAVKRVGARRVAIDSLDGLFERFGERAAVRHGLEAIAAGLEGMGVTAVMTMGRLHDYDAVTAFGVEEFVADNVVILRNSLVHDMRRRTVEVLKLRGTHHRRGEYPFGIIRDEGIVVIPLVSESGLPAADERITTGNPMLDEMCDGGVFQDAVTLVSGSTGIGKTTLALRFVLAGIAAGGNAVFAGFEESRHQLLRGFRAWGIDIEQLEAEGRLRLLCDPPEAMSFDEHLVRIKRAIAEIDANRLVVDSLTTLERSGADRVYREFVVGLSAHLKDRKVAAVLTSAHSAISPASPTTDRHISALADTVLLMRYVELNGEVRRCLVVLKLRGSDHDRRIREFTIGPDGVAIGGPLAVQGVLSDGTAVTAIVGNEPERTPTAPS